MTTSYSVTDALALAKQANKVLTEAAAETWNRMKVAIEETLRPSNRNCILGAFKAQQSMQTCEGSPAIYMSVGGLSGGVTRDDIGRLLLAAGAPCNWKMSVPAGANTAMLELWITVITTESKMAVPNAAPVALDDRSKLRRMLEEEYTTSYLMSLFIYLVCLLGASYFFLDASPATRAVIFG